MKKCETCFHRAVCYSPVLEDKLGGHIRFKPCNNYVAEGKLITVDEDMALALCAGAVASERTAHHTSLFEVGGGDQRTISFHDASRTLRRAGEAALKLGGMQHG